VSEHPEDTGSYVEAVVAEARHEDEHLLPGHLHHPEDPNAGVVRGQLGRGAVLSAVIAAAVTLAGFVLLAIATGGR